MFPSTRYLGQENMSTLWDFKQTSENLLYFLKYKKLRHFHQIKLFLKTKFTKKTQWNYCLDQMHGVLFPRLLNCSIHMGRIPQDGKFGCFVSLFKKLYWTNVAEPDLLRLFFFIVLWRAWLSNYTTSSPTPHQFTIMHCNGFKMHQKCTVLCVLLQCIFGAFWMHCNAL